MARRTLLPILLTPVVVVLFGVTTTTAGNAEAQPGGTGGVPWPGPSICAEGLLAFADIDPTGIELAGSIQPCTGTDPAAVAEARWGVARYHTQGAFIFEGVVRPFDSATAPTPFEVRVELDGFEDAVWGQLQAACLITARMVRLACVEITTEWTGGLHIGPIPVADPRVKGQVTVLRDPGGDPECGACV